MTTNQVDLFGIKISNLMLEKIEKRIRTNNQDSFFKRNQIRSVINKIKHINKTQVNLLGKRISDIEMMKFDDKFNTKQKQNQSKPVITNYRTISNLVIMVRKALKNADLAQQMIIHIIKKNVDFQLHQTTWDIINISGKLVKSSGEHAEINLSNKSWEAINFYKVLIDSINEFKRKNHQIYSKPIIYKEGKRVDYNAKTEELRKLERENVILEKHKRKITKFLRKNNLIKGSFPELSREKLKDLFIENFKHNKDSLKIFEILLEFNLKFYLLKIPYRICIPYILFKDDAEGIQDLQNIMRRNLSFGIVSSFGGDVVVNDQKRVTQLNITSKTIFDRIPDSIGDLKFLKKLRMENCQISSIPNSIRKLKNLTQLRLEYNRIQKIPDWINELESLEVLNLHGNLIKNIPDSVSKLKNLERLDLARNEILFIPESLLNLKSLLYLEIHRNRNLQISNDLIEKFEKKGVNVVAYLIK